MSHKVNVREQMGNPLEIRWAGYALLLPVKTISKHTIFLFDRMITLLA